MTLAVPNPKIGVYALVWRSGPALSSIGYSVTATMNSSRTGNSTITTIPVTPVIGTYYQQFSAMFVYAPPL